MLCYGADISCRRMSVLIRMPFGLVSGVGRMMAVLDGGGYRRREGTVLGVNFRRSIVTNGAFATWLFSDYFEDLFLLQFSSESVVLRTYIFLNFLESVFPVQ